jgi:hypothetical protein
VFVTANQSKHREVARLLSGLDVRWERLDLARPAGDDVAAIARARVAEAFARLGTPCFLENTGLWLYDHEGAPGASFKKAWRERTFETHVTVAPDTDEALFRAACGEIGVKCIDIELPRGETVLQPMTGSFHRGSLLDVQKEAFAIGRELVRRGFTVTRTKIEQHGRLAGTPETDHDAARAPATSYFEYHLKIAVPPAEDLEALANVLARAGGHLSSNASQGPMSGGMMEHFVTLRVPGVGKTTAEARFAALLDAVATTRAVVRNRIREYTVFDSNPGVDAGWIP